MFAGHFSGNVRQVEREHDSIVQYQTEVFIANVNGKRKYQSKDASYEVPT